MEIVSIEVIPIRAQRKELVRAGAGTTVTHSEFGIIRVQTNEGVEGLGEISITAPRIGFSLCFAAETLVGPALIGLDPRNVNRVLAVIDRQLMGELSAPYIRAAFEMALLDIVGKHVGVPVYQLLGGRCRETAPLAWSIYQKTPAEMAADAAAAIAEGFTSIKLKVGRALRDDLDAVAAVAAAVGSGVPLRLDANMAWKSVPEAARAIDEFSRVATIAWVEQPLGRNNLDGLRLLRQRSGVPIMADESLQTPHDAYLVARAEAADVFNVYISEAGGILAARQIFEFAAALEIPCIIGSQAELGIGTAAAAHLAVSVPNLPYPIETFGTLRYPDDVVTPTPPIARGGLTPPTGPGLGISLNHDVVERWRVRH